MKNRDKSVYPQITSKSNYQDVLSDVSVTTDDKGLTKKEHFMGMALQGLLSGRKDGLDRINSEMIESYVKIADQLSDEILKRLEK